MRVGVVIPYFQRDSGILAQALQSIFRQELPADVEIAVVIIDDASPAPVGPELDLLAPQHKRAITVLSQANAGPGAARNRGIDHLVEIAADYVAFLDSDDTWAPCHLAEAVAALQRGFNLYFCAHERPNVGGEQLDGGELELARLRRPAQPGVTWLSSGASLIAVESDRLLRAHLTAYVSQTSTVVLAMDVVRHLRFDPRLRGAGEDHLFWIELALSGNRAVISSSVNVSCGHGVNIYFSAFDFGSPKVVERVGFLLLFWKHVKAKLKERGVADPNCEQRLVRYRRAYSYLFVRSLLRRQVPSLRQLRALLAEEPLLALGMPFRFLSVLPRRSEEAPTW